MSAAHRFVDQSEFHSLARARRAGGVGVMRPTAWVQRTDAGDRTVRWVMSDSTVDRAGDRIFADGWDLENYKKSPVVLWGHDAMSPPIGRALNVHSDGARLVGDVQFAPAGTYELADTVYGLVKAGYVKAGSVGFLPGEYRFSDDKSRQGGIDFTDGHELLEFSICSVPMNAGALAEARARGLNVAPLERWARARGAQAQRVPLEEVLFILGRSRKLTPEEAAVAYPTVADSFELRRAFWRGVKQAHQDEVTIEALVLAGAVDELRDLFGEDFAMTHRADYVRALQAKYLETDR